MQSVLRSRKLSLTVSEDQEGIGEDAMSVINTSTVVTNGEAQMDTANELKPVLVNELLYAK